MKETIKLILMSNGQYFTEEVPKLFHDFSNMKIAYINTAPKGMPDQTHLDYHVERMKELKFNFEIIDLAGKNETALLDALSEKDLIYVQGGNTFYLLKYIRESGFEKVIKDLLEKGVVYAGASAGAYVACPTIETAVWSDTQHFDRCGVTDFTAMNLYPSLIKAHCTDELKEKIKPFIEKSKYKVDLLSDGEALVVTNEGVSKKKA